MHNVVMCTLSLYDVIEITRHQHIKLKLFITTSPNLYIKKQYVAVHL